MTKSNTYINTYIYVEPQASHTSCGLDIVVFYVVSLTAFNDCGRGVRLL